MAKNREPNMVTNDKQNAVAASFSSEVGSSVTAAEKGAGDTPTPTSGESLATAVLIEQLQKAMAEVKAIKEENESQRTKIKEEWEKLHIALSEKNAKAPVDDISTTKALKPTVDAPLEGYKRAWLRVELPHTGARILHVDHSPGSELYVRARAVEAYNKHFHIIQTEHAHTVTEVNPSDEEKIKFQD